jgi:trehalose synthase
MAKLEEYAPVAGKQVIDELYLLADKLQGKSILNVNSTAVGGGVAEILNRMLPLMKDLGVDVKWDVIRGDEKFFVITKKFHNALHGVDVAISTMISHISCWSISRMLPSSPYPVISSSSMIPSP